jgi:putative lipoprotein
MTAGTAVRGTATYRERIALPQNAVFEATLEDVSRSGAQSELIARVRNEQPGNIPIPFVISYNASRIIQSHTYAVRSRILVNGSEWFANDQNYPVLTGGRGSDVQLLLRRVGSSGNVIPPRAGTASLEETHWKLVEVAGSPVTVSTRQPEPNLTLHSSNRTVSGNGGCNRFSGSYSLNGDRLAFSQVASTMMACTSGMNPEAAFHKAINATRRWRINGQTLELLDDSRNVLARLEAVYM